MTTHNQTIHKILIAPDKFKGSLTSLQAANAIRRGMERRFLIPDNPLPEGNPLLGGTSLPEGTPLPEGGDLQLGNNSGVGCSREGVTSQLGNNSGAGCSWEGAASQLGNNSGVGCAPSDGDPVAPLQFQIVEIADGGDGSLEVLKNRIPGAKTADVTVHDPLGREVVSQILLYSLPGAEKDTFLGAEKKNVAACAENDAETRSESCSDGFRAGNGAETRAEGCGNEFCAGNGAEMRSEGCGDGFCAENGTETRPEGCVNGFCAGNGVEPRAEGCGNEFCAGKGTETSSEGCVNGFCAGNGAETRSGSGELCAFIEMAKVSGLEMLAKGERNPLFTSTYGMGEAIKAAVANGATQVTLSIGGSATNDGGAGMLQALGYRFLDAQGGEIAVPICGGDLQRVAEIVTPCTDAGDVGNIVDACNVADAGESVMCGAGKGASGNCAGGKGRSVLSGVKFKVICDVSNPLLGPQGATAVYGPQKGADAQALVCLEAGLANFAAVAERCLGVAPEMKVYPGAGAAGGVGYAGTAFLGGNLVSGWKFFTEITSLEEKVQWADLVITGEGSVDSQSLSGKIVGGVMELARKWNRPVEIFCGISSLQDLPQGVRCYSLASIEPDLQVCMTQAAELLEKLAGSAGGKF